METISAAISYIFWISFFILAWCYLGYGLFISFINAIKKKKIQPNIALDDLPTVAFLVAAYNEEGCIKTKLHNSLALKYPAGRLSIHLVTDGSTDNTFTFAKAIHGIQLYHQDARAGKVAALQRIIPTIAADILVFSDANCLLTPDALVQMMNHFGDASVGAVSGEKKVLSSQHTLESTEGLYWKYESWLKREDAKLNTLVGAAGELFAIRKELYHYLPGDSVLDDFMQSMLVCIKGKRVDYEPAATALEPASSSINDEFERKKRISAGAFQSMKRLFALRALWAQPVLVFQFLSHRVLRWTLCPIALPLLLTTSAWLAISKHGIIYSIAFFMQVIFYLFSLIALILYRQGKMVTNALMKIPFYFSMMNLAVYYGFFRYIRGKQSELWKKAHRNNSNRDLVETKEQVQ